MSKVEQVGTAMSMAGSGGRSTTGRPKGVVATSMGRARWDSNRNWNQNSPGVNDESRNQNYLWFRRPPGSVTGIGSGTGSGNGGPPGSVI